MPPPPVHRRTQSSGVHRRGGFTLIELLLAVTLCGLLLGFGVIAYRATSGDDTITCAAISGNANRASAVFLSGRVRVWEVSAAQTLPLSIHIHGLGGRNCAMPGNGDLLLADDAVGDYTYGWMIPNGRFLNCPEFPAAYSTMSPDGRSYVGSSMHSPTAVYLRDVLTRERKVTFDDPDDTSWLEGRSAISPDGRLLAAGYRNERVKLWNVADQSLVATLTDAPPFLLEMKFSPDGRKLAARGGQPNGTNPVACFTSVWDLNRAPARSRLLGSLPGWSKAMSFLPDSNTLAIVGDNGIELWDVETGSQISKIDVAVKDFSASTDCRTWLIADDNSVTVWDATTGKPIRTLWRSRESLNMAIICVGFFATIITWAAVRARRRAPAANAVAG